MALWRVDGFPDSASDEHSHMIFRATRGYLILGTKYEIWFKTLPLASVVLLLHWASTDDMPHFFALTPSSRFLT